MYVPRYSRYNSGSMTRASGHGESTLPQLGTERKVDGRQTRAGASLSCFRRSYTSTIVCEYDHFTFTFSLMSTPAETELDGLEQRIRQRIAARSNPLDTVPTDPTLRPRGLIPNTPLSVSLISFLLGSQFAFGLLLLVTGGHGKYWWATYQLGFYLAAWSAFHWGEFAVTAGWNRDKCSVDCECQCPVSAS